MPAIRRRWRVHIAWVLAVLIALASVAAAAARGLIKLPARTASITIESTPAGADVLIAGASKGRTPVTFALPSGRYEADVVSNGEHVPVQIAATSGAVVSHHVRFAGHPVVAPAAASLVVTTEPGQLHVTIDGVDRGASPVHVTGLAAGAHKVRVASASGAVDRDVEIKDGESLSVLIVARAAAETASTNGWLSATSAVPVSVVEKGRVIGGTGAAVLLPAGSHDLEFVNDDLAFHERRRVTVAAGKTTALRVDLPRGRVSINAVPWADVWVDGEHVGETPIGNYELPIGTHQIVFRHPQMGERRERVIVGARDVARVAVNFGNK